MVWSPTARLTVSHVQIHLLGWGPTELNIQSMSCNILSLSYMEKNLCWYSSSALNPGKIAIEVALPPSAVSELNVLCAVYHRRKRDNVQAVLQSFDIDFNVIRAPPLLLSHFSPSISTPTSAWLPFCARPSTCDMSKLSGRSASAPSSRRQRREDGEDVPPARSAFTLADVGGGVRLIGGDCCYRETHRAWRVSSS